MIDKIKITYVDNKDRGVCYLTRKHLERFALKDGEGYIGLTFGSVRIKLRKVTVESEDMNVDRLHLSRDAEKQLYLLQGTVLQIKKIDEEHLELGPFIGVFINQEKVDNLLNGKGVTAYTQFHNTCRKLNGICCFFSIENIDWDKKLVKALMRKNSVWTQYILPLPKTIYDRNVENNCRVESIELRKRLKGVCQILNPMAKLAKWETIKALEKNSKLLSIIPKTARYRDPSDMQNNLKLSSRLYVKPDALSKGKGIFRVSDTKNGEYKVEYRTKEANHSVGLQNLKDLESLMEQYLEKGGSYIIQQEINKAIFRGNPFDFRALFQKDYEAVWQLSGVAGRVAGEGSIITSPRSGGSVENFETILKEVFNESPTTPNGLYENIVLLGREVCLTLEKEFGTCIELGLDMCIDVNRKIWIIEVNGKPLKVSLKRLGNPEIIKLCNRRPIEYAVRLAGFVSQDTNI